MSSKGNISINFETTLTNEEWKSLLLFFLSNDIWFVDLSYFRAEVSFPKLFHIFWDTLLNKRRKNCEFHKKKNLNDGSFITVQTEDCICIVLY